MHTKNHLLFPLLVFISIVFIVATVQQPLFQTITAATLSLTPSFPADRDSKQLEEKQTDIVLVNRLELLPPRNATINIPIDIAISPTDLWLNTGQCLGEWAIYVHGVWTDRMEAIEQAQRTNMSIEQAKIDLSLPTDKKIPLFAFVWEGNTILSPFGWDRAKGNADAAGHELADIIAESKGVCPTDTIRIIAHSLGSRVVLSALDSLENNTRWKHEQYKITSVHLMGAAVDAEKVSKNESDIDHSSFDNGKVYGNAIERNVQSFTNLYSSEDDMLERWDQIENETEIYPYFEDDTALGSLSVLQASRDEVHGIPSNYKEKNVTDEILPIEDADAGAIIERKGFECDVMKYNLTTEKLNCTISANNRGDNHKGYMGFRNATDSSRLISDEGDGAIDVIVSDWWLNESSKNEMEEK